MRMLKNRPVSDTEAGVTALTFALFLAIIGVVVITILQRPETWYFFGEASEVSFDGGATQVQTAEGRRRFETMAAALVGRGMMLEQIGSDGRVSPIINPSAEFARARQSAAENGFPLGPNYCFSSWRVTKGAGCTGAASATLTFFESGCGTGAPNTKCETAAAATLENSDRCFGIVGCLEAGPTDDDDVVAIPARKQQIVAASDITGLPGGGMPTPTPTPMLGKPLPTVPALPEPPHGEPGKGSHGKGVVGGIFE